MARDVEATWTQILTEYHDQDKESDREIEGKDGGDVGGAGNVGEGVIILQALKDNLRYLVDAWTS